MPQVEGPVGLDVPSFVSTALQESTVIPRGEDRNELHLAVIQHPVVSTLGRRSHIPVRGGRARVLPDGVFTIRANDVHCLERGKIETTKLRYPLDEDIEPV